MKQRGFTLIEIVIVIALVSIAGIILSQLFIDQNRLYRTETAELDITNDARMALDDIDNYLRLTNRTLSSYSTFTAGSQVLILQIQSINSSNQLIPGVYDDVVYYLSGSDLFRQVFANASSSRPSLTKKLASNVTGLNFTYNNADYSLVTQVITDLTIEKNAGIQTRAITLSSQARLRNY